MSTHHDVRYLYANLSAPERAALRLRSWKEDTPDPRLYRSTPFTQIDEVNELTDLFQATDREATWHAAWLKARLAVLSTRLAMLRTIQLWALHADRLREQVVWRAGEPITRGEHDRLAAEAGKELIPLDLAAELLLDEEPDADELSEEQEAERCRALKAKLEGLIKQRVLVGRKTPEGPAVDAASFYAWRQMEVLVQPALGLRFAVFPDEAVVEVERLRAERQQLLALLDRAPQWPPAEVRAARSDASAPGVATLAAGMPVAISTQVSQAWREILAIEQVLAEVGERFAGEEPLHPDSRRLLVEVKAAVLKLVEDLAPEAEVVLPEQPDGEAVRRLRSVIEIPDEVA